MNLVRLSFIFGMVGLAAFSINAAIAQPYHEPVAKIAVEELRCRWDGGYDRVGFVVAAVVAMVSALGVAITDLVRRVY